MMFLLKHQVLTRRSMLAVRLHTVVALRTGEWSPRRLCKVCTALLNRRIRASTIQLAWHLHQNMNMRYAEDAEQSRKGEKVMPSTCGALTSTPHTHSVTFRVLTNHISPCRTHKPSTLAAHGAALSALIDGPSLDGCVQIVPL